MSTNAPNEPVRRLISSDLSDLAIRLLREGGPAALAGAAVALTEGAATALPGELLPEFCRALMEALKSGGEMAGSEVVIVETEMPSGGMH